jgi:hypothetical protein
MARALKSGRVRFNRLARRGAFALLAGLLVRGVLGGLATSPALAALPAFDVSPASLTIQAGDTATGTLSNLPVGAGDPAEPGCLGATGTVPSYLTVSFSTLCSSGPNWSSSLTVKTIPATPAGTYTIVFEVCPTACYIAPDVRSPRTIDTKSWTVVVTPAPVPVETVPFTSAPAGSPAPASQTPHPSPTPSHSAPRTVLPPATSPPGTQPATSTPTPAASPSPGTSPAVASGGVAPGLVLDHSAVAAGQTLRVSGTGCAPAAPAIVAMPGSVTGTTTAGPDGAFQVHLQVPSSLRAGRYPVVAQCGTTLSAFVDVQRPRSIGTAVVLAIAAVVILLAGAAVGWFTRGRRRAGPS